MKRYLLVLGFVLVMTCRFPAGQAVADLDTNFQWLSDMLDQQSGNLTAAEIARFEDFLSIAEKYARDSSTKHYVTQVLLEAFIQELVNLEFESLSSQGTAVYPLENGEDEDDLAGEIVKHVDGINAALFFASTTGIGSDPGADPPEGECGVRILLRSIGPALVDPGGTLNGTLLDLVQLEAEASETSGTFTWELSGGAEYSQPLYTNGSRAQLRLIEPPSNMLTVRFDSSTGHSCEDTIRIHIHGNPD